jgi:hypothetical protein
MPLGLGRLAAFYPRGVAWAWGINGIASVVASAGAVAVAILMGFPAATAVAFACYLAALALARIGAWPTDRPPEPTRRAEPALREPAAADAAVEPVYGTVRATRAAGCSTAPADGRSRPASTDASL